jgi:hypothetical protein
MEAGSFFTAGEGSLNPPLVSPDPAASKMNSEDNSKQPAVI